MTDALPETGRRERKKTATRDAMRTAARDLFARQGVAATSIEQITEAADVSPRTFFRYFESKYDLLLPDLTALFSAVEAALAARPAGEAPIEAFETAVFQALQQEGGAGTITALAPRLDPVESAVSARLAQAFVAWEERLTGVFADRAMQAGATDPLQQELQAVVTAGVAVAGMRAVVRLLRRHPDLPPSQRPALLRSSFSMIRRGL